MNDLLIIDGFQTVGWHCKNSQIAINNGIKIELEIFIHEKIYDEKKG